MKNNRTDEVTVEARKKHGKILKPNLGCTKCKGKGQGNAKLRLIIACPSCYVNQSKPPKETSYEPKPHKSKDKKKESTSNIGE